MPEIQSIKPAMTRSQIVASDIAALIRARNPLIWVTTREEARVEEYLMEAAASSGYLGRTWDVAQGVLNANETPAYIGSEDINATLTAIGERSRVNGPGAERCVWILRDAPIWLSGFPGAQPCRALRNLARALPGARRESAQCIIVLTPIADVPLELAGHAVVIEWPMPDRFEIEDILRSTMSVQADEIQAAARTNGSLDSAVIDAAVGLSGDEAAACYGKSLVLLKRIDAASVAAEKRRVIAREKVLEWSDPLPGGIDAVGGLDLLKGWLAQRRTAYSPEARAYGLPLPKGILLVGPPGTGKTMTARAVATAWGVPLLKFDLGALKSKFVGDSEQNIRRAFKVIEAIGRCVVLIDEIEKALAGATQGGADGGVSADALGSVLGWMQDRTSEAFVVASSNDISKLPPELLRKGRFDEIWFVDLPNVAERRAIIEATLRQFNCASTKLDTRYIAQQTEGFTGSEIASIVPDAMFSAFADNRRGVVTGDLIKAAEVVVPLSKTAGEKIKALQDWAKGKARFANLPPTASARRRHEEPAPRRRCVKPQRAPIARQERNNGIGIQEFYAEARPTRRTAKRPFRETWPTPRIRSRAITSSRAEPCAPDGRPSASSPIPRNTRPRSRPAAPREI